MESCPIQQLLGDACSFALGAPVLYKSTRSIILMAVTIEETMPATYVQPSSNLWQLATLSIWQQLLTYLNSNTTSCIKAWAE